jgi:hypothetical protein
MEQFYIYIYIYIYIYDTVYALEECHLVSQRASVARYC